jgi:hypothetical protein
MLKLCSKIKFYLFLIIVSISLSKILNLTICERDTDCVAKANTSLSLKKCGNKFRNWFRNDKNKTQIWDNKNGLLNQDDYSIDESDTDNFNNLIIKKLKFRDSGKMKYIHEYAGNGSSCYFNLFIYGNILILNFYI